MPPMMTGRTAGNPPRDEGFPLGLAVKALMAFVFVIFGLTVVFGSWYTIDATERGILLRNGAVVDTVQPGLHFKMPWIESVVKVDMQTHTRTYGFDKNTNKDTMEAYSADQQPAYLRISVTLHVAPDKVQEMYTRFGGAYEGAIDRVVMPHVYERAKVVFGQYTANKAISSRGALNADIAMSLTNSLAYDPVFIIESVQVENISFSPDYIRSVEQRMQAEVEVQKLQQNLAREKVQADITVTKATAEANSIRATAQANADAVQLQGKAKADVIKLTGEAEAIAIKAKAAALGDNPNLIPLTQAEKWNGALPSTMVPGGAVPFLSVTK